MEYTSYSAKEEKEKNLTYSLEEIVHKIEEKIKTFIKSKGEKKKKKRNNIEIKLRKSREVC